MKMKATLLLAGVVALGIGQAASAANVLLDGMNQGGEGNRGASFRPMDEMGMPAPFLMTARWGIDNNAPYDPFAQGRQGTIYIDNAGAGVQDNVGGGSKGISGSGGNQNEEIIFTFDTQAIVDTIVIGLTEFNPGNGLLDEDDPVLFLEVGDGEGPSDYITLDETQWLSAYHSTGSNAGVIRLGELGLGQGLTAISLVVRETNKHIFVNSLTAEVPAPGALALLGLGGLVSRRRRRR